MRPRLLLIAAALSAVCVAPARALEVSGRIVIADAVAGPATAPIATSAAYDATLDRFLVTWLQQGTPAGDTTNVWGRFVTSDGVAVSPSFLAATVGTGIDGRDALGVTAAYDERRREYLLVVSGLRNPSFPRDVELYGQWLDDGGERIGSAVALSTVSAGTTADPVVVADPARDRFVLAYAVRRPSIPQPSIAVQAVQHGAIGRPSMPFGDEAVIRPGLALTPQGPVLGAVQARSPAAVRLLPLGDDLTPRGADGAELVMRTAPSLGPALRANPATGQAVVAWADGAGGALAPLDANGGPGLNSPVGPGAPLDALDVLPVDREGRWLALTRASGAPTIEVTELSAGAGVLATASITEPDVATVRALLPTTGWGAAFDRTRQWALVPYGVTTPTGRALLARVIATSPPTPPQAPEPAPAAVARCNPGAVLYLPAAGSACGAPAVATFTVAPMTDRRRRNLLGIAVRPTTRRQRIRVECVARCGRLRPVLSLTGRRAATDVMFGPWRLPRKATLEVRIEEPEATTRFRRFARTQRFPFLATSAPNGCRLPIGVDAPC